MKVSNCAICMKEFSYQKGKKYCCCPECSKERNQILNRWRFKMKDKKPKRKKILSMADINKAARKNHMTYGEYVARTEGGMR